MQGENKVVREALGKRLKRVGVAKKPPAFYRLFVDDLFNEAANISGCRELSHIFDKQVHPYITEKGHNMTLAEMTAFAAILEGEEGLQLLYRMFITPFAALAVKAPLKRQVTQEGERNGYEHDNAGNY